MAKPPIFTAIDIGTQKCVTVVAQYDESSPQKLQVSGVSIVETKGMKRAQIVNLESVIETLTESINAAERMAGHPIDSALIGISGTHIRSKNSKGVVAVSQPSQEITQEDVARVIEAARAVSLPPEQDIIHVIPRDFIVDSQTGIKDPVGMTGIRLESEAHLITALSTALKNTEKCVVDVGLQTQGFVFTGLASAYATLTETEKELGVVSIDIGAGTTALCAYIDGAIAHSATLPIGARHITQDIALGCRISLESAEKVKLALSSHPPTAITRNPGESKDDLQSRRKKDDVIDLKELGISEGIDSLSKKTLIDGIIVPRVKEIMVMIGEELESSQSLHLVPAGLVLSGGGAQTVGVTDVAKRVLNLPARVATMPQLRGITHDLQQPAFATSIGLLLYGRQHMQDRSNRSTGHQFLSNLRGGKISEKLQKFLQSLMP